RRRRRHERADAAEGAHAEPGWVHRALPGEDVACVRRFCGAPGDTKKSGASAAHNKTNTGLRRNDAGTGSTILARHSDDELPGVFAAEEHAQADGRLREPLEHVQLLAQAAVAPPRGEPR